MPDKPDLSPVYPVFDAAVYGVEARCHGFLPGGEGKRRCDVVRRCPGAGDGIQQVVDSDAPEQRPQIVPLRHACLSC